MWKDYFSFNKRQRNGILVLLSIILVMLTWLFVSDHLEPTAGKLNSPVNGDSKPEAINDNNRIYSSSVKVNLNYTTVDMIEHNPILAPYAKEIVAYREKLGGFYSKEQLKEIHGIDTNQYSTIRDCVDIDSTLILKFNLNTCTIKDLARHPYFGYFLSQAIVNYRNQHGNFKKVSDLRKSAAIDDSTYYKISPYCTVN